MRRLYKRVRNGIARARGLLGPQPKPRTEYIYFSIALGCAAAGCGWVFASEDLSVHCWFNENIRAPVFTAFMTASSLLSAGTIFILQRMRDDLMKSDALKQTRNDARLNGATDTFLSPLVETAWTSRIAIQAMVAVGCCVLVLGTVPSDLVAIGLIAATTFATAMLSFALHVVLKNIVEWVNDILLAEKKAGEDYARKKLAAVSQHLPKPRAPDDD